MDKNRNVAEPNTQERQNSKTVPIIRELDNCHIGSVVAHDSKDML